VIIFRYLAKEIITTLAGLTSVLMLIFMSNQFVHYLNRAASGRFPGVVVFKLMMLEIPNLLGLLLPLGFFVAILVAYGRLYADNEMTVMQACGYSPKKLLIHTLSLALFLFFIVMGLMLWVAPEIATGRAQFLSSSGIQALIQTIVPQRFKAISGGSRVFYVQSMSRDHERAKNIFLAEKSKRKGDESWNILWADNAYSEQDDATNEQYIVLKQGREYEGVPGKADFKVSSFSEYKARLPHANVSLKSDVRTAKTKVLWPINNKNKEKAAEIQWRLSVPIMVITLTLIAVPLSRVNPRQGKYAKLLPALIIYILYANMMFVGRDWIINGVIPTWLGLWWLHGTAALIGIGLIIHQQVRKS
jgi:lipopolysaccharide export system permease protein